jgi:hypothetical protein
MLGTKRNKEPTFSWFKLVVSQWKKNQNVKLLKNDMCGEFQLCIVNHWCWEKEMNVLNNLIFLLTACRVNVLIFLLNRTTHDCIQSKSTKIKTACTSGRALWQLLRRNTEMLKQAQIEIHRKKQLLSKTCVKVCGLLRKAVFVLFCFCFCDSLCFANLIIFWVKFIRWLNLINHKS